jgi:hypothetical protein
MSHDVTTGRLEQVDDLIRKLRRIPDGRRRFAIPASRATAEYQLPAGVLARIVDAGLSRRGGTGEAVFDHFDLLNLSLDLRCPSAWTFGMRWWGRLLESRNGVCECRVGYAVTCPDPGHAGDCHVEILTPDRGWIGQHVPRTTAPVPLATVSEFRMRNEWPQLPPRVLELVEEIGQLEFKRLPSGLGRQAWFIHRSGLADCVGAALLLRAEARRRGLAARFSMGLVVAPPYSTEHSWVEFHVADVWVPVDPLLVAALVRWGVLDPRQWHVGRSIGGVLGRLAGEHTPTARHNGDPVELSMPTVYRHGPVPL